VLWPLRSMVAADMVAGVEDFMVGAADLRVMLEVV
jgi:hypothetical protein